MRRINFFVTDKQAKQLKKEKETTGLNLSEILRRAIDKYFRRKR